MITYPLAFPSAVPASIRVSGLDVVGVSRSIFTLESQAHQHQGQAWAAEINFPPLYEDEAEPVIAWLLSLNGRAGTFLMSDPTRLAPRGAVGGTPAVNGAGQTGQALNIKDCTPSVTGWLKAGDYIQVGDHLHRVLTDVDTDVAGNAALDIWPRLREVPNDGDLITVTNTKGLWRLASNERSWDVQPGNIYTISISAIEAF